MDVRAITLPVIVLAAALGGCDRQRSTAAPAPSGPSAERVRALGVDPNSPRGRAQTAQLEASESFRTSLRRSFVAGEPWYALALSGGGQWGAFGAGFLKGWTERGDRPQFRVVTGTSTGSLISTFAFLGSTYDDQLGKAYLDIKGDDDIFNKRFLLTALFSSSLYTTGPLRRRLEATITPEVMKAVADEGARGRQLYVGAVDLDAGTFKAFNLTEIAGRGGEQARRDYVDALMASTAIPVLFPPVTIGAATFVDGGIRRNIFAEAVAAELRALGLQRAAPRESTMYCLVNGSLNVGYRQVPRKLLDTARRTVDVLLDESTDGNLLRIYLQAHQATPSLQFRMTLIPPAMCNAVGSEENQFDPALMRCLYDEGRRFAREDPEPWRAEPPLDVSQP
jgi:predicted acylesterase/phospholipase RssA